MTADCGCCSSEPAPTPQPLFNRPALPEISYRVGRYADFRRAMIAGLSSATRAALAALKTRDDDDPTIALLDAWAVSCDVLTFYTERLANEACLRTARDPISLQELGKLLGYRLNPGVAAETYLALSLERPVQLPTPNPPDPGGTPPAVPDDVVIDAGLRVQSVPGPGQHAQTFETVEPVDARPQLNALPVYRTVRYTLETGRLDAWFAWDAGVALARGDVVLITSPDAHVDQNFGPDHWDLRIVKSVVTYPDDKRMYVVWDRGLGSLTPANDPAADPDCWVLRKRAAIFGHNAPMWAAMPQDFQTQYVKPSTVIPAEWPGFVSYTTSGTDLVVDLDGNFPDIVVDSWVVLSEEDAGGFYREAYKVVERSSLSRAEFAISGPITRLKLKGEAHNFGSPRLVTVYAVNDPLTLVEAPDPSAVDSSAVTVTVSGDASAMVKGRAVILAGTLAGGGAHAEVLTVQSAGAFDGVRTQLTFVTAPKCSYVRASAVVYGNVAKATHGETVKQVLGDGDARQPFQAFPLRRGPVTYVQSDDPSGGKSTLEVAVNGVDWHEVASQYDAAPTDHTFLTAINPDGTDVVRFGDGVDGARVPSGSQNVVATYRVGLGTTGNLDPQAISQLLDRPLGLKAATNPIPATGGVDPETSDHARASMPLPMRTLGRVVSIDDYADFALASGGIGAADAAVLNLASGRTVVVTVAGPDGATVPDTKLAHLTAAIANYGNPFVPVVVLPHRAAEFRLALKVVVDPDRSPADVLAAVETALRAAFGAGARSLGQPVFRSGVIGVAAAVAGVVAVDLDRLYTGTTPSLQDRLLADHAVVDSTGEPVAAQLLALSGAPFDGLSVMSP